MPALLWTPGNPAHAGKFKTGAKPTPAHKIAKAICEGRLSVFRPSGSTPTSVTMVPPVLSMEGNDAHGDCVSAEEAFAKAAYSVLLGLAEQHIADQTVIDWASAHGVLEGADLMSVMQDMQKDPMVDDGGTPRLDGPGAAVDYTNADTLRNAISQGPIKVGISSSSLPSGAGNQQGWYSFGAGPSGSQDHCTTINGYGTAGECFKALNVALPSGVDPAKPDCYLHYTWSTIGVTDFAWLQAAIGGEAYLRTPTTTGLSPVPPPPPPPPPPGPGPTPTPGGLAAVLTVTAPADAAGAWSVGAGGLSPDQVATLRQVDALVMSLLPPAHSSAPTPADLAEVYRHVNERGLSPTVNYFQLILDVLKTYQDIRSKSWLIVASIDIPAIMRDLGS